MKKKTILSTALMLSALSTSAFAATPTTVAGATTDATTSIAGQIVTEVATEAVKDTALTAIDTVEKVKPTIGITLEERFFAPHISGGVQSDNIKYNGGEVDWKDTLGLGNEHSPETILRYKNMSLDWIHYHSKGDSTLASPLTFDGKTYNDKVESKTNFDYLKFSVENPIVKTSVGEVKWNYGLAGLMWDAEVKGTAGGVNTSSSKSFGAPVPMVGVNAKATLVKGLNAYTNVSGLPLGGYGHIVDLEAGLHYEPVTNFGVNVGYRMLNVDLHHNDDSASFKLAGPFAGLSYTF